MTIVYKTKDSFGRVLLHRITGAARWQEETSPHDPYTLRIVHAEDGRKLAGPMVGEFYEWVETDD